MQTQSTARHSRYIVDWYAHWHHIYTHITFIRRVEVWVTRYTMRNRHSISVVIWPSQRIDVCIKQFAFAKLSYWITVDCVVLCLIRSNFCGKLKCLYEICCVTMILIFCSTVSRNKRVWHTMSRLPLRWYWTKLQSYFLLKKFSN